MPVITNIEDLRLLAKKRVPRMFYDYADCGSWTESTYRANEADFDRILLRQRVAVNLENRSTRTTMIGQEVAMPVAIAPVGLTGMQHADGEMLTALAAKKFGIPFTLSTMSICSIEDVAQATGNHPFWFQLYVMKDRDFIERLIDRAKAARCSALMLTLDLQILGQRHKDIKNGLSAPPKLTLPNILNMMTKPRWGLGMLGTPRREFRNIVGHVKGVENMGSLSEWTSKQFDPSLSWNDVEWIKKRWGGKLILKGIQDPEDARLAVESGADALIVSNHGGRQLDGAPSSISALPEIVDTVGSRIEVHMDGGIRSGQHVLKAVALGAKGTYIGRAFVYGLGAMGEAGVTKALEIIQKELDLSMAFCGRTDIRTVDRSILLPGRTAPAERRKSRGARHVTRRLRVPRGRPSSAAAGGPRRQGLQELVDRLHILVGQFGKRLERHHRNGAAVGALAGSQHRGELGDSRVAAHHAALARREIRGRRPVRRAAGNLAAGEVFAVAAYAHVGDVAAMLGIDAGGDRLGRRQRMVDGGRGVLDRAKPVQHPHRQRQLDHRGTAWSRRQAADMRHHRRHVLVGETVVVHARHDHHGLSARLHAMTDGAHPVLGLVALRERP